MSNHHRSLRRPTCSYACVLLLHLCIVGPWSTTVEATPVWDIPDPVQTRINQAEALMRAGQRVEAIAALDETLTDYPGHRFTLYTKAKLLASSGRHEDAQKIVDILKQDDPVPAVVLHLQGFIYSRYGEWEQALEFYKQAYPAGHDRYMMNTMTEAYVRTEGTDATIDFLSDHLDRFPDEQNIRLTRARLHARQQAWALALRDYEAVREAMPQNPAPWKHIADLHMAQGDKAALGSAREAARLAPTVPEVLDTLGRALLAYGDPAEALAAMKKAVAGKPREAGFNFYYAKALAANGHDDEARDIMKGLAGSSTPFADEAQRFLETMAAEAPSP